MRTREDLHILLQNILKSNNVYFQPPSTITMNYPAIVYARSKYRNNYAGNSVYMQHHMYTITVIDKNPDSPIADTISKLETISHDTSYTKDNLNHFVFTLYY